MSGKSEITLKAGLKAMDFKAVTGMLEKVYWSPGISEREIIRGAKNSALVAGAFDENGIQVGYARVVSDKTRFAYILDVVVHESFRKTGIGRSLVRFLLGHKELKDVYQWMLCTRDAHGVYKKLGFKELSNAACWMEIRSPRPER